MVKYDEELKSKVVTEYLEENVSARSLSKKYGIKSHKNVLTWVNSYKRLGIAGLEKKDKTNSYSVQFKLDVLNYIKNTNTSLEKARVYFGLPNAGMISSWKSTFLRYGVKGLYSKKEYLRMNKKTKKTTREQELELENELLRLEVAALKKLKASQAGNNSYHGKNKLKYPMS